jgi:site-specific recombinase XerD
MSTSPLPPSFASLLQDFFCKRLIAERNVSGQTVASYRDTFRLLLKYAEQRMKKAPEALTLADLDAPVILGFLDQLQKERGNCARTRNLRLVAVRSFLHYASYRDPAALPTIQRVLAIPMKRFDRPLLGFLSHEQMQAVLDAPDRTTWSGQRDHIMLSTFYNTGARVSEIIGLRVNDVDLDRSVAVHIRGKGRKQRVTPLWRGTARLLRDWLVRQHRDGNAPVFSNRAGHPLSRSGVEQRLRVAVAIAQNRCPSLRGLSVSPHTLRHTTAMHLLQSGVDLTVIALWLGHESPETTHHYIEADLTMKERALASLQEPRGRTLRYRASDRLLAFLDGL